MRTKTPEQIYDQAAIILLKLAIRHWDGHNYVNFDRMCEMIDKIDVIRKRYVTNIYNYHTGNREDISTEESNRIYRTPTEVSIYMNYGTTR